MAGALQLGDTVSAVMRDHAKDGKQCGGAALTHRGRLQLGFGWRSQIRTAGGDLRLLLKAQQRRARCRHDSRGLVKLDVEQRRATTYGNRERGEDGGELQPGAWSEAGDSAKQPAAWHRSHEATTW
jgi:hypothetical protein